METLLFCRAFGIYSYIFDTLQWVGDVSLFLIFRVLVDTPDIKNAKILR